MVKKHFLRKVPSLLAAMCLIFAFALTGCDGTGSSASNGNNQPGDNGGNVGGNSNNQPGNGQPQTFTVTFNSASGTVVPPQTVEQGEMLTAPSMPETRAAVAAPTEAGLWTAVYA